ncbi:hypothetical protein EsH8_III_001080 [Colletotrichum jinshuiense]
MAGPPTKPKARDVGSATGPEPPRAYILPPSVSDFRVLSRSMVGNLQQARHGQKPAPLESHLGGTPPKDDLNLTLKKQERGAPGGGPLAVEVAVAAPTRVPYDVAGGP